MRTNQKTIKNPRPIFQMAENALNVKTPPCCCVRDSYKFDAFCEKTSDRETFDFTLFNKINKGDTEINL